MTGPVPDLDCPLLPLLPRRGEGVQLRGWTTDDIDTWRKWQEPHHRWLRSDGPYFGRPTAEELDQRVEILQRMVRAGAASMNGRMLVVADVDGAYLGTVSRYRVDATGWTAIGVGIHDDAHWGRGYGREAVALWVDLLFEAHPELHRLDARTWSGNVGMCRVAEACGFTLEARFREARVVDGERYDGLGYGLLRREWEAGQISQTA